MTEIEKLQQRVLFGQAVGAGLAAVIKMLVIEHVKVKGGDHEANMVQTKKLLDNFLAGFSATGTDEEGISHDASAEIKRRIGLILSAIEGEAREALDLSPPVKERH
jgi:hypothetical protein